MKRLLDLLPPLIEIKYNGKSYRVRNGDVPGVSGIGQVTINSREGNVNYTISGIGLFINTLDIEEKEEGVFVNGVNLNYLVNKHKTP